MRARQRNYRTPDDVFFDPAVRIPIRKADASFAYLFFDLVNGGRVVGNNGVQVDGRIYRLTSLQRHLEYWGERVDVRINPDDQRMAMIFDHRNGAFVCKALADTQDATYSTRDEVTRNLIARVFSDCKHLKRMANEYVDGASSRIAEYRRAKIEYLTRRATELRAQRERARAVLTGDSAPVTVIGSLSSVARADQSESSELTADVIADVLDADEQERQRPAEVSSGENLCVVSTRRREPNAKTGKGRRDGALGYAQIAAKLGRSLAVMNLYRRGVLAWPAGMKDQFEYYERLRAGTVNAELTPPPPEAATPTLFTRRTGAYSYAEIAKALGTSRISLQKYRTGAHPWPAGMKERFEKLSAGRLGSPPPIGPRKD